MEHSKHILRMVILVLLLLIAVPIIRTLFIPKSFGRYGHYRADNVREQMAMPVRHGESASCAECHDEKADDVLEGSHETVQCEDCHAPLATHIEEGEIVAPMQTARNANLCLRCHDYLEARPDGFPQIRLEEHLEMASMQMSADVCFNCHAPHSPRIGG